MGTVHFFACLSLLEEYAFHICETAITLAFIWVYGRLAIRHILALGRKDKRSPSPKLMVGQSYTSVLGSSQTPPSFAPGKPRSPRPPGQVLEGQLKDGVSVKVIRE